MGLFLFFIINLSFSKWWNFSDSNFYVYKKEESKFNPIVALFTNSTPDSFILEFYQFSINHFNNSVVDFTHIDCLNNDFCKTQKYIQGFPSIYLIQGNHSRYWKRLPIDLNQLKQEIDDSLSKSYISKIESQNELNDHLKLVKNGGSLFHLDTQDMFKAVNHKFEEVTHYFHIFNSTFVYSHSNINVPTITSYYSLNCFQIKRIRPIEINNYVKNNLFSFYHRYDSNELKELLNTSPYALIVTTNETYNYDLYEKYNSQCHKFKFGYVDYSVNMDFIKEFKLDNEIGNIPFVFLINVFKNCYSIANITVTDKEFENILKGESCIKIGHKFNLHPIRPKKKYSMSIFVILITIFFGVIYFIFSSKETSKFPNRNEFKPKDE